MKLDLTEPEKEALKQLLELKIRDMRTEISHTDKTEYKDALKARKEIFKSILTKFS